MLTEYNLTTFKNIFFIGIGGISMSGLAEILHKDGVTVSGSDFKESDITKKLTEDGISVVIGHSAKNIPAPVDLVVYTAAVKEDNPELIEAKRRGITTFERATLLGLIMKKYKFPIAIAGTHGKTTTSSMVSQIFLEAEKDPTITIGGIMPSIGGNIRVGSSEYIIVESCEYCDSFLKFFPYVAIILNVEPDHMDYFENINQIMDSFKKFANLIPSDGSLIINSGIENYQHIIANLPCHVITYGNDKNNADWYPENIVFNASGLPTFDIYQKGTLMGTASLSVPGLHNVYNAIASCASSYALGLSIPQITLGLERFTGTNRRFQKKGVVNGVTVVDDYAHHPTEIKATLTSAKNMEHHDLWCVFQPHTYTRTKAFITEFSEAFDLADKIIITDIYSAREKDTGEVHSTHLVDKIKLRGKDVYYLTDFNEITNFLITHCEPNDLLITLGAGDVFKIGESMLSTGLSTLSTAL